VRYYTFSEAEADFELGVPVERDAVGDGEIVSGLLPGGPVASTWHHGTHDGLGEAYSRIQAWLQAQGREPNGPAWEVYSWIDPASDVGPDHWPEPAHWRTQLVQPLA
jgi:effector-binding domain-containing protein